MWMQGLLVFMKAYVSGPRGIGAGRACVFLRAPAAAKCTLKPPTTPYRAILCLRAWTSLAESGIKILQHVCFCNHLSAGGCMPRHIHCLLIVLLLAALSVLTLAGRRKRSHCPQYLCTAARKYFLKTLLKAHRPLGKQKLLSAGHSEFWEIAGETEDVLVFASMPFRDTAVHACACSL